jgi:phenylpyruvate tautomerase PptA (4-oxalocrotonate tautomerase family)
MIMAQIRIYGRKDIHGGQRQAISDAIHACAVDALALPVEKRFHRFCWLDGEDFIYPDDRSDRYLIVEISMFAGRSVSVKKEFIRGLFARLEAECGISPQDVEITITETPRENWGIRGLPGDELNLTYVVEL